MSDFTVSVDFDASAILRGFQKLEQDAKAAGASAGKGLAEGLQGFSSKSITALQQELQRLTQRQLKVDVDSRAFTVTGDKIKAVQAQLDAIQRRQVAIGVDSRSITALNVKLQGLQEELNGIAIGSQRFRELQGAIEDTQRELARAPISSAYWMA
jgi:DNA repair exonuclease SbcCD ATPase subunit